MIILTTFRTWSWARTLPLKMTLTPTEILKIKNKFCSIHERITGQQKLCQALLKCASHADNYPSAILPPPRLSWGGGIFLFSLKIFP
jgi:hypothetical protein